MFSLRDDGESLLAKSFTEQKRGGDCSEEHRQADDLESLFA